MKHSPCTGGVPKLSKREPGVSDCAESIESRRRNACRGVGEPRSAAAAFTVAAWLRVTTIGEHIWLSRCSMSSGSCAPARHTPVKQVSQQLRACRPGEGLARCLCLSVGFTSVCSHTQAAQASPYGSTGVPASAEARGRLRLCLALSTSCTDRQRRCILSVQRRCTACSASEVRRVVWEP